MNTTTSLVLQLVGPVFVLYGLSLFTSRSFYLKMVEKLGKERFGVLLAGFINVILGILLVTHHWYWESVPEIVVSLMALIMIGKGVHIVLFPESWLTMARRFVSEAMLRIAPLLMLLIGGWMTVVGFGMV